MRNLFVILIAFFIPAVLSAQVDTLQLVEIGSIQAPTEVTELYVEDLNSDGFQELILCTSYYVYIYNSQTYQAEWTSPPLNHPMDMLFKDINRDGLIDFSVKDSSAIYLFDPHTPQTIWISPPLDSTYKCYTIGDRNDDDWIDVAIVTKEPLTRFNDFDNRDTVWIVSYDGPLFNAHELSLVTMNNYIYHYGYYWGYRYQYPVNLIIGLLDGNDGRRLKYILFSYLEIREHAIYDYYSDGGEVFIQNCQDDSSFNEIYSGSILYSEIINIDNISILYSVGKINSGEEGPIEGNVNIRQFSSDTLLAVNQIWNFPALEYYGWHGLIRSDIDSSYYIEEVIYGSNDSIHCLSYDGQQMLWETGGLIEPFEVTTSFKNESHFSSPQIICGIDSPITHYELYDGEDGTLSAYIPAFEGEISMVSDLDNDGIDAILSIQDSELRIYLDETATDFNNGVNRAPGFYTVFNYPNPFNATTTIEFLLNEQEHVKIDIYDLLGRRVETLLDRILQRGSHQTVWDASGYASGIYYYRIQAGEYEQTKRMVYLR